MFEIDNLTPGELTKYHIFHSNGGQFEFLPVTVSSAGATLKAVLRLGLHAGIETGPLDVSFADLNLDLSAGLEVGVFVNVAEFTTNITTPEVSDSSSNCEILVQEEYQFAIGAEAGATVAVDHHSWGPSPETTIPIWYTTLGTKCAKQATPSTTSVSAVMTPRATRRQNDLTTTTISTTITYTGVECQSSGLVNCPISLQSSLTSTTVSTLTTEVPSGSSATFPATTLNTVTSNIPFGFNANTMTVTSGSPVSYTPPATHTSVLGGGLGGIGGGGISGGGGLSDEDKKIIIGVSVGVGVPLLIVIIAGCL